METTIMSYIGVIIGFTVGFYGGMSKLWSLFWGTLNIRCRNIIVIQKGPIFLTTTHMQCLSSSGLGKHMFI